jgi:hypothetical protein
MNAHGLRRGLAALTGDAAALGGILLCAASIALAQLLRHQVIEPDTVGAACAQDGPFWCPLRTGLIMVTEKGGFGWLAIAGALLALAALIAGRTPATRVCAAVALAAGGFGMVLYNATIAAPAVVLAVICLTWRR